MTNRPFDNTRACGTFGEEAAAAYLTEHGCTVTGHNLYIGHAEIDLLAETDTELLFIEVKTRTQSPCRASPYGRPADAVDSRKRAILLAAAERYLLEHPSSKNPRFDIIEVYLSAAQPPAVLDIRHYPNAVRRVGKFSPGKFSPGKFSR